MSLTKYDPDRAPDPARWLAGEEAHLTDLIERYHRRVRIEVPRPHLHAVMHLVVENQIALGDELPVAATVARLVRDGLSRHEAIHAVGSVLLVYMGKVFRTDEEFDQDGYSQDIGELTEERWRAEFGEDDDA